MFDSFFWFIQPSQFLSGEDYMFAYIFGGLLGASLILRIAAKFIAHKIDRKIFLKLWHLTFWVGLSGIIWFGLRYENTWILGRRYWAGLIFLTGIVWLFFVFKYLVRDYRRERSEYDHQVMKSKYMPGQKSR